MICPKCSSENRPGAKFCNECGASLLEIPDISCQENSSKPELTSVPELAFNPETVPEITSEEAPASAVAPAANATANPIATEPSISGGLPSYENSLPSENSIPFENSVAPATSLSSETTIDLKPYKDSFSEDAEETLSGLDHSGFEDSPLFTPWEKGVTMKMKPVEGPKDSAQRVFKSNEQDTKPKRSKKPLIIILVVLVLAAAAAFGTWYFELWGGHKVPDVVNMSQESATAVLSEKGFTVRIEKVKSDDEEGLVLLTDPQAGSRLSEGGEVVLHVSVSREMPSLTGLSKAEADKKLKEEGFTNITFSTEKSNEAEDTVLSTSPEAGTKAKAAYPITVTLAEPYRVPNVVDESRDNAIAILEEEGYKVSVERVYTEQKSEGTVISSSPEADEKLNSGETVTIYVAASRANELVSAAQSSFAQGTSHTINGVSYEVSSLSSVTYAGNDTTTVSVEARAYTILLGITVYLDPASYTWTVTWTSDNQISSVSSS